MTLRGLVAGVLLPLACGEAPVPGRVRVSLTEEGPCQDYCVDTFGSQIFMEDGVTALGPAREVECGQDIVFLDLPAGTRVRVRAWLSEGPTRRLEGEGGPATVVSGETISVTVPLKAIGSPVVTRVSPEPAWPGVALTITGTGFGTGRGLHGVELDGRSLDIVSWSDDTVVASLHPDDDGGLLAVRECGVSSLAVPVRVLVETPGRFSLSPLGCAGMRLTGAAAVTGATEMVLAFACDLPAEGYLQRYEPADCAPFGVPTRLSGRPTAMAASRVDSEVFVATGDGLDLLRVPVPLPPTPPNPFARLTGDDPVSALAATPTTLFALTAGPQRRVFRLEVTAPAQPEVVVPDLDPVAIAASPSRFLVVGTLPVTGDPVIVVVSDDDPRIDVRLLGCVEPTAVAVAPDGSRAAVACSGAEALVIAISLLSFEVVTEPLGVVARPSALALDRMGDGALVWDPDSGTLAAASVAPLRWHRVWDLGKWTPGGPLVRHPSRDDYLTAGPSAGEVSILSPYTVSTPCPGGTN